MKFYFLILIFFSNFSFAQLDTLTIISFTINLSKKCKGIKCKYKNGIWRITESKYNSIKSRLDINSCAPCYLIHLGKDLKIDFEGEFYTDCCIGVYVEKYKNGNIKVKGQYILDNGKSIFEFQKKDNCGKKNGTWNYYSRNGKLIKIEKYENGNLMSL